MNHLFVQVVTLSFSPLVVKKHDGGLFPLREADSLVQNNHLHCRYSPTSCLLIHRKPLSWVTTSNVFILIINEHMKVEWGFD